MASSHIPCRLFFLLFSVYALWAPVAEVRLHGKQQKAKIYMHHKDHTFFRLSILHKYLSIVSVSCPMGASECSQLS